MNSFCVNFTNSAVTPNTNLLQQVSVYQTVNSFTGGSAREFVLRKFHEFSRHTQHQPASAGFGVSDREFIHGRLAPLASFAFAGFCSRVGLFVNPQSPLSS
ncbi:MAG: hypothetical protein WAW26_12070, partial [Anaerolineae bacterium]